MNDHSEYMNDLRERATPRAKIEGDELVIRIDFSGLVQVIISGDNWPSSKFPYDVEGFTKDMIRELELGNENARNLITDMLDAAALAALKGGSKHVVEDDFIFGTKRLTSPNVMKLEPLRQQATRST